MHIEPRGSFPERTWQRGCPPPPRCGPHSVTDTMGFYVFCLGAVQACFFYLRYFPLTSSFNQEFTFYKKAPCKISTVHFHKICLNIWWMRDAVLSAAGPDSYRDGTSKGRVSSHSGFPSCPGALLSPCESRCREGQGVSETSVTPSPEHHERLKSRRPAFTCVSVPNS